MSNKSSIVQTGSTTIEVKTPMGSAPDPKQTKSSWAHYEDGSRGTEVNGRTGEINHTPGGEIKSSRDMHSAFPGILGTARTLGGNPINDMSQINDKTRISVQGVDCEVGTAVRMGYLVKLADGTYAEPGSSASRDTVSVEKGERAKAKAGEKATKTLNFVSPINNKVLGAMKKTGGDKYTDAMVSKALAVAIAEANPSGEPLMGDRTVKEMERTFGIPPEDSAAFLEGVLNDIQNNAVRYMSRHMDVDGGAVMDYMHEKMSKTAQVSIMTGLYHGDKATLHKLVSMYKNGDRV